MKNDEIKRNPFSPGDRVVCIVDGEWSNDLGIPCQQPKKNCIYTVFETNEKSISLVGFDPFHGYDYRGFAPVQDATEMQEDETCEQVAKETEAEYANRKEQKIEVVI